MVGQEGVKVDLWEVAWWCGRSEPTRLQEGVS